MRFVTPLICLTALLLLPVAAQAQGSAATGAGIGKHDTDQPIEISADSLEVLQDDETAIFRGNVDVVQGKLRLRANELKVHYRSKKKGGGKGKSGSIQRIVARGQVSVSSPNESAKGDNGVYDVEAAEITLTGKVVLKRGQNVIRGRRLVLHLATGISRMEGGKGDRVRGVFTPSKKK